MMQNAVMAGLLPNQPLETRFAAIIETATFTYLEALGDEDRATAKLYVQKAAQAADEAWQQTVDGYNGPSVANPTVSELEHPCSASQDEDSDDTDFISTFRKSRLSAPQLQAQLSRLLDRTRLRRLEDTLLSKRAWQQVTRIEDLRHACLPQVALPLRRMCGKCPHAARLHHQRAEKTWQQGVDRLWSVPTVWFLLGPTTRTRRNLQHRRSRSRALRTRSRLGCIETRRPGHDHGTQRAHSNAIQAG